MNLFARVRNIFAFGFVLLFSWIAFAQLTAPPQTVEEAAALAPGFLTALALGQHNVIAGFVLMIVVVAVRQFAVPKWNLNTDTLPFVTILLSILGFLGLAMSTGVEFKDAILSSLTAGIVAVGGWEVIGKFITKLILGDKYAQNK